MVVRSGWVSGNASAICRARSQLARAAEMSRLVDQLRLHQLVEDGLDTEVRQKVWAKTQSDHHRRA
jgi:hypothetical protein